MFHSQKRLCAEGSSHLSSNDVFEHLLSSKHLLSKCTRYKRASNEVFELQSPIKILLVSFMCMLLVVVLDIWYCCAIENTFSDELLQAMRNYGIRREDRALVDQVQVHFKCCAINGYQDWLQTNASHILVANA
uniref:Tetraspanin n=1 Tax=Parascaris univalens TaxID=6257 RepID=A0A914ZYL0_PARUN